MTENSVLNPTRAPEIVGGGEAASLLGDLSGKKIALLRNAWPSWDAMTDRLAELITERSANVSFERYMVPNGSAASPELLKQIAAETDAAVVGLANCGSCTAWSFHDSIELQALGLPTVLVVTKEFKELADALASAKKTSLPRVLLPLNPETVETSVALGLVDDSVDDILSRLTEAVPSVAATDSSTAVVTPRFAPVELDSETDDEAAHEFFYRNKWTDGLPIRLPIEAKVNRMLAALGEVDPETVIAAMPPTGYGVTYEALAINAVMAGATPDLMPILVAVVRAACVQDFNLNGIATTTGPSTPVIVVNGPIAAEVGVNSGRSALAHGHRANLAIGRTLRLLINNIGGAIPGEVSKSIMGQPGRLSFCFAEREDASPWAPLHVDRGFEATESAVTLFGATGTMNLLTPRQDVDAMLTLWADGLAFMGNPNVVMGKGTVGVLITPGHARALAGAGMSKADVAREIWQRATIPIGRFPESAKAEPPYEFAEHDGLIYPVKSPDNIFVLVVGGPEPTHSTLVPSHPSCNPVSCVITPTS